jgi:hypothetical protein
MKGAAILTEDQAKALLGNMYINVILLSTQTAKFGGSSHLRVEPISGTTKRHCLAPDS